MQVKREPGPGQARLEQLLKALKDAEAQVGWFETSKYPETDIPVAYVAAIHEFGYTPKNIPPRLGARATMTEKKNEYRQIAKNGAKQLLIGGMTLENLMGTIGDAAAGDLRHRISTVSSPILKDSTVAARARKLASHEITSTLKKPLVETGYLLNSLTYTVVMK